MILAEEDPSPQKVERKYQPHTSIREPGVLIFPCLRIQCRVKEKRVNSKNTLEKERLPIGELKENL
jgi:hypothetical protein